MIEIPEARVLARQITEVFAGRTIASVCAAASPHSFAWYFGDPTAYPALLTGRTIQRAHAVGSHVEVSASDATLLFSEGVNMRRIAPGDTVPTKHQLLLGFDDGAHLCCSVQMYGGLSAYPNGANDNPYYIIARDTHSVLSPEYDEAAFDALFEGIRPTLSVKALLATEQRIPGLGNGVLQDILFLAGLHPKCKALSLSHDERQALLATIKSTLHSMEAQGGRDTERDLFGTVGGYRTLLSRKTWQYPCPQCGGHIERKAYLGGNVYYCASCQREAGSA